MSLAPVPTEAPVEAPKVVEEQVSPKFAALAREQKAAHRQRMELKAEREAIEAQKAEYATKYIPKDRLKSDFLGVMTEAGLTPEEILTAISSQEQMTPSMKLLMDEMKSVKEKLSKSEETAIELQKKQYEQAVTRVRNEVKLLVDSDTNYETIKASDAQEAVVELIKETFEKENKLLTTEEAATIVENYLLDEAMKLASLEKVKQRLTPKVETPVKGAPIKQQQTLTHANTTAQSKPLTPKERRERAIAAFRGELA